MPFSDPSTHFLRSCFFHSLLKESLALSGLNSFFPGVLFWKAFKRIPEPDELELKKSAEVDTESVGNFKGPSPSITPLGKIDFIRTVELTIPNVIILSIPRMRL